MTTRTRRRRITEAEWQAQVVQLAETLGWGWMHVQTVTVRKPGPHKWNPERTFAMTPTDGPLGVGWPDLVLMRERVVYAELKREGEKLKPGQELTRDRILAAGGEHHVWTAPDLEAVQRVLTYRAERP
jgi:hypothetical protein